VKIFQKHHVVTYHDIDQLKHVNNVRYVQWVQDLAESHWNFKISKSIEEKYFWVMLKHIITYKGQAFLGETMCLKTYVKSCEGAISSRMVEIYNKSTNTLIVTSETQWCLMSRSNNKPVRIPEEIVKLFS